jgi:hypothetical protein
MRAALVNGRLVAPSYVLSNGEVVEVRREPSPTVTPSMVRRHEQWVGFVRTRTAKLKIKQFLKDHARRQRKCGPGGAGGSGSESSCEDEDELCSTDEAGGGGGRPGNSGGAVAPPPPRVEAATVKTLSIQCADKMGLLAAVCNIITDSGHNIKVRGWPLQGQGPSPLPRECAAAAKNKTARLPASSGAASGPSCRNRAPTSRVVAAPWPSTLVSLLTRRPHTRRPRSRSPRCPAAARRAAPPRPTPLARPLAASTS